MSVLCIVNRVCCDTCCYPVSQLEDLLRTHDNMVEVGGEPIRFKLKHRKLSCFPTKEKTFNICIHLLRSRRWMIFLYSPTPFEQVALKHHLIDSFKGEFYSIQHLGDPSPTLVDHVHELSVSVVLTRLKEALTKFPSTLIFAGV